VEHFFQCCNGGLYGGAKKGRIEALPLDCPVISRLKDIS
jgi:hypothetical protein